MKLKDLKDGNDQKDPGQGPRTLRRVVYVLFVLYVLFSRVARFFQNRGLALWFRRASFGPGFGKTGPLETGFTLLEVLIAIAILAVGIMAVMQLFPAALKQSRSAAERTQAANMANSELSQLRILNDPAQLQQWYNDNATKVLQNSEAIYNLYSGWQTTLQQTAPDDNLLRVTFSVVMIDGRKETFVTYVTNP